MHEYSYNIFVIIIVEISSVIGDDDQLTESADNSTANQKYEQSSAATNQIDEDNGKQKG